MKSLLTLSVLFLAACADALAPGSLAPSQSRSEVVSNDRSDFEATLTACSGEPVLFSGTYRNRVVDSKNTSSSDLDFHGTGVGLVSGKHYSMTYVSSDRANSTSDVTRMRYVITGGGEQPFTFTMFTHTVATRDGTVVVVDRSEIGCD
jgi:hypothetical protein